MSSQRFQINLQNSDGEFLRLFKEPNLDSGSDNLRLGGYFIKLDSIAESEDWVQVQHFLTETDTDPRTGWIPVWGAGAPVPDRPQNILAHSLAYAAARNVADMFEKHERVISSEYLLALFLIENGLEKFSDRFSVDTEFEITGVRPNKDAVGAYAITTEDWSKFQADEEFPSIWSHSSTRHLPLPQMRAAAFLAREDWKNFLVASGSTDENPMLPRKLDLFISRLVGPEAAAEIARRERDQDGLNEEAIEVVRMSRDWNEGSPKAAALLKFRSRFLVDDGQPVNVTTFIERCESVLDAALKLGFNMVQHYVPGFQVVPGSAAAKCFNEAEQELKKWSAGWTEHKNPGQKEALAYFEATDHGDGKIKADNEITDWCGAFAASIVKKAGFEPPPGSAAAASWTKWGDVSLPDAQGSKLPQGAVVTLSGGDNTDKVSHVCFFVGWEGGDHFIGLGGNQEDSVKTTPFLSRRIVAIRTFADKEKASEQDFETLAKTLYGEIRGGSDEEVKNVAHVVMNRFLTGYRSHGSIAGTCLSPKQFSCWNLGTAARTRLDELDSEDVQYQRMFEISQEIINDRLKQFATNPDQLVLQGARHYHKTGTTADWVDETKRINISDTQHTFYVGIA